MTNQKVKATPDAPAGQKPEIPVETHPWRNAAGAICSTPSKGGRNLVDAMTDDHWRGEDDSEPPWQWALRMFEAGVAALEKDGWKLQPPE